MSKTPSDFLQGIIDGEDRDVDLDTKIEAAKALLPYTAKKMVQEFANTNKTQFEVGSKQLAALDDDELELFIRLLRKIEASAESSSPGTGAVVQEVQQSE